MGGLACLTSASILGPAQGNASPFAVPGQAAISRFPAFRKIGGFVKAVSGLKSSLQNIFLAAIVLAAGSASAASKGSLELQHPTQVGGTQLKSGSYTVQWEGTGDQVELKIYKGKEVVASTSARVVKVGHTANDAAVISAKGDGTSSLVQIRLRGKEFAFDLSDDVGASGAAAGAPR
jgi:hypothetical protein